MELRFTYELRHFGVPRIIKRIIGIEPGPVEVRNLLMKSPRSFNIYRLVGRRFNEFPPTIGADRVCRMNRNSISFKSVDGL